MGVLVTLPLLLISRFGFDNPAEWTDNSGEETSYVVERSADGVNYVPITFPNPAAPAVVGPVTVL
jgi:hypothetical protein